MDRAWRSPARSRPRRTRAGVAPLRSGRDLGVGFGIGASSWNVFGADRQCEATTRAAVR
jgi:hypothetical protein